MSPRPSSTISDGKSRPRRAKLTVEFWADDTLVEVSRDRDLWIKILAEIIASSEPQPRLKPIDQPAHNLTHADQTEKREHIHSAAPGQNLSG